MIISNNRFKQLQCKDFKRETDINPTVFSFNLHKYLQWAISRMQDFSILSNRPITIRRYYYTEKLQWTIKKQTLKY